MKKFKIKRGDTSPALVFEILPRTILLTGATVVFNMQNEDGDIVINRAAAEVLDDGDGTEDGNPSVRYPWQVGDTASAGDFQGEFEVTYADAAIETFPNSDDNYPQAFLPIVISKDIG